MRNRLILGRFIDTDSWVHRLDPRSKITAMLLYFLMIMFTRDLTALALIALFSLIAMKCTRIPYSLYFRAFKPLRFLIAFIFIFPAVFDPRGDLLLGLGPLEIHSGGLMLGIVSAARMMLFVSFTAILTFTTAPARLTQGLEEMMKPLKYIGISPERWSLMIGIALRFIPTILEEAEIILKAQASRGADFKELPWKDKAKMLISLLVPVTAGAFRRATDLVDSMEARGYRLGMPRSKYIVLAWRSADTLFTMGFVILTFLIWWEGSL
jgi:energy-coupling factor transport system permease protein